MLTNRVTAVFDSSAQAEQAITALRRLGVTDAHLSVVSRQGDSAMATGSGSAASAAGDHDSGAGKGAVAGATAGALFGLMALAIPGVGPFVTAGFLAQALGVTGGAIAAGAIVGGTSGAIAGALSKAGYDEHEAQYYGSAVEQGGVIVAVDTTPGTHGADQVRQVFTQYGGRVANAGTV